MKFIKNIEIKIKKTVMMSGGSERNAVCFPLLHLSSEHHIIISDRRHIEKTHLHLSPKNILTQTELRTPLVSLSCMKNSDSYPLSKL